MISFSLDGRFTVWTRFQLGMAVDAAQYECVDVFGGVFHGHVE